RSAASRESRSALQTARRAPRAASKTRSSSGISSVYRAGRRRALGSGPYDSRRRLAEDAADRLAHRVGGAEAEIALCPRAIHGAEELELVQLGRRVAGQAGRVKLVDKQPRVQERNGHGLHTELPHDRR